MLQQFTDKYEYFLKEASSMRAPSTPAPDARSRPASNAASFCCVAQTPRDRRFLHPKIRHDFSPSGRGLRRICRNGPPGAGNSSGTRHAKMGARRQERKPGGDDTGRPTDPKTLSAAVQELQILVIVDARRTSHPQ